MGGILVLGGDGMLGHKMFQTLVRRFPETSCTIRNHLTEQRYHRIDLFKRTGIIDGVDAMEIAALERLLVERKPDVVINCVGVVKQRPEANFSISSITINSLLPHRLALVLAAWGGRLIHFSTDCVFSGKRGSYLELDSSDAEDLYGKTKFLGEVVAPNALTLRTSIIGRELFHYKSLLEWFLSQNHRQVQGFKRHYYSGVTTNYLAELVGDLLSNQRQLSGLYQVTAETISKYDLLCLLREAFGLDIDIVANEDTSCDRSMVGRRFVEETGYRCPSWWTLVEHLASDPTPYESWR